ncbi:hypothetical protein AB8Z76_23425 [Xanthomonas phaseoli pv. phaseoli]|uniref:hypothetical protein n=1 Tax=Xanthomonas TaxID=338 RepID=UPI003510E43F
MPLPLLRSPSWTQPMSLAHDAAPVAQPPAGRHVARATWVIPPLLAVARSGAKRPSPTSWQA